MNLPYFISSKIKGSPIGSFSRTIYKVGIYSTAIAVGACIMAYMIMEGFQRNIEQKVYQLSGQLLLEPYTLTTSYEDNALILSDTITETLNLSPLISHWQPYLFKAGLLQANEEIQGVIFKGIDSRFDTAIFRYQLVKGRMPNFADSAVSSEIVLSSKIAKYLKLEMGNRVVALFIQEPPRYRNLTVVGLYETGLEDFDERIILGDMRLAARLNDWNEFQVSGVEVFLTEGADVYESQDELFNALPNNVYVENVEDKYVQIFDWLRLLQRNVLIFLFLIIVVAAFSMISIVVILIKERTQMVGILLALGAQYATLRHIFWLSGLHLVIHGLFWGNLISLSLLAIQYAFHIVPLDAASYYMNYVPVYFDITVILAINLGAILLIALALYIPLQVIQKISPVEAIRYQ